MVYFLYKKQIMLTSYFKKNFEIVAPDNGAESTLQYKVQLQLIHPDDGWVFEDSGTLLTLEELQDQIIKTKSELDENHDSSDEYKKSILADLKILRTAHQVLDSYQNPPFMPLHYP